MRTDAATARESLGPDRAASREAARPSRSAALGALGLIVSLVSLASADGGYFPTSWGWTSLSACWLLAAWFAFSGRTEAGALDLVLVGSLALFAGWIGLSIVWSEVASQSVLELERALVPVSGVAAFVVLARRQLVPLLAGALLAGVTVVTTYAVATRLFPDRLGSTDAFTTYRLSEPIGYWNGLGIFTVVGILVALALVTESRRIAVRAGAAAAVVPLATALYFTYSRASWVAIGVGVAVALAVSPQRLRLLTLGALTGLAPAVAVLLSSRSRALTNRDVDLADAVAAGELLAPWLIALTIASALLVVAATIFERRTEVPTSVRRAYVIALTAVALATVVAGLVRFGDPVSLADRGWAAFSSPPIETADLNERLFTLSSNGRLDLWRAAGDIRADHPWAGSGAGTFERFWQARADASFKVRDAHSLFVETIAELGPFGLALLVTALGVPLLAAARNRRGPLVPGLVGGYTAFLVHAGADWDWELTGVTLTALIVGALLVVGARRGETGTLRSSTRVAGAVVAGVVGLGAGIGLLGNSELEKAKTAVERGALADAMTTADRARVLQPWSSAPLITRGEAERLAGREADAEESFRAAIEIDSGDWRAWLNLATVTSGAERRAAIDRARALYPRGQEVATVTQQLEAQG